MSSHGATGSQTQVLDDDFVDSFAVVGPPERCVEKLQELVALVLT